MFHMWEQVGRAEERLRKKIAVLYGIMLVMRMCVRLHWMKFFVVRPTSYSMKRFEIDLLPYVLSFLRYNLGVWLQHPHPQLKRGSERVQVSVQHQITLYILMIPIFLTCRCKMHIFTFYHHPGIYMN